MTKKEDIMQDAQHPYMDQEDIFEAYTTIVHVADRASEAKSRIGVAKESIEEGGDTQVSLDAEICNVNLWNCLIPGILPPHTEWPMNAKELEILIPKKEFFVLAQKLFNDAKLVVHEVLDARKIHNFKVNTCCGPTTLVGAIQLVLTGESACWKNQQCVCAICETSYCGVYSTMESRLLLGNQ